MSDTCAGACCAVFPLHMSHPSFRKEKLRGQAAFIADMIVPLTRRQALRRSRRLGYPDPPKYPKGYHLFTCRHWDETTRLCTVYEKRPLMCRDYPYLGRECERGCGYKLGKSDAEAIAEREDNSWLWDAEANGYRPRSTSKFVWDARRRVLQKRAEASVA